MDSCQGLWAIIWVRSTVYEGKNDQMDARGAGAGDMASTAGCILTAADTTNEGNTRDEEETSQGSRGEWEQTWEG